MNFGKPFNDSLSAGAGSIVNSDVGGDAVQIITMAVNVAMSGKGKYSWVSNVI